MSLRDLIFDVAFNGDVRAITNMNSAADELRNTAASAMDTLAETGKTLEKTGKSLMAKVTAPIMGLGSAAVYTMAQFDDSMSKVQALSGATGDDLEDLRDMAKDLGSTTAHSASSAADAMGYLALAGFDTNQILSATPAMLNLASAASMDLATSADIVSDTMSAFGMAAEDANIAADMFAVTQAKSNTDVLMLGEAMKYAGAAANAAGMDLAQTNAVLGVLADQSIKGSMGGTTFTRMLGDMRKNADDGSFAVGDMTVALYDAEGNMRSLGTVMEDIETATEGMTTAQRDMALGAIFGEQAMKGVNAMLQAGSDRYKELESAIYNSEGASAEMAEVMEDNLAGAFRALKSATEGLFLSFEDELKPAIKGVAETIKGVTQNISNLDENQRKIILSVLGVAAAIGPLLFAVGKGIKLFTSISGAVSQAGGVMAWIAANPAMLIVGAVIGIVGALVYLYKSNEQVRNVMNSVWENIKMLVSIGAQTLQSIWQLLGDNIVSIGTSAWNIITQVVQSAFTIIKGLTDVFVGVFTGDWGKAWEGIKTIFKGSFDFFKTLPVEMISIGANIVAGLIKGIFGMVGKLKDTVVGVAKSIGGGIKDFFGIKSPSRLMMEYGGYISEGLGLGIEKEAPNAEKSMQGVAEAPLSAAVTNNRTSMSFSPKVSITVGADAKSSEVVASLEKEFDALMERYAKKLALRNPVLTEA